MQESFSYVIVDDEPKSVRILQKKISQLYPKLIEIGSFNFWQTALDVLRNVECDILFLDISMPQKNGFDMLELLPDLNAEIIFITAHEEYAIKAFSQNVAGYILKPIDDKIFAKTLDKTVNNIKFRKQSNTIQLLHSTDKNTLIGIHNNNDLDYVSMQEILYFEANMRYTRIVTNAKVYTSSYSIGKFRTAISGHDFFQIHRSFIINLNHVRRYQSPDTIILDNGHKLPISKSLKGAFMKLFHIL